MFVTDWDAEMFILPVKLLYVLCFKATRLYEIVEGHTYSMSSRRGSYAFPLSYESLLSATVL